MIQLTLQFNSIEAAIAALREIPASTLANTALVSTDSPKPVAAQKAASGPATAKADAAPTKTAAEKAPAAASAETQPQASTAATTDPKPAAEASAQAAPAASTASSSAPVEYAVLQKAVFTLAGKSREAAGAVAQSFGVKTFKELPEAKWAAALAAVQAKTAELEAA